ncbi:hypothetical protein CR513_38573, partial [Mucuna pruriens]
GHINGNTPVPNKGQDNVAHAKWEVVENEYLHKAIGTEFLALDENQTWDIVSCPPFVKPLGNNQYDPSLFLQRTPRGIVVLLVYVDDIVVHNSNLN